MKKVSHKELGELLEIAYDTKSPLFIWGTFGIGKSTIVKDFAESRGLQFVDVRISQLEPSDLRGLPKIDNGTTKWLSPDWLPTQDKGILFLDEINLAPPSIQASAYQLVLDRRIGSYSLPDGWVVVTAGNRIEDKANVFELPTPLANRFIHAELNIPSIEEWQEWGFKNKIDSRIISFLNWKPSNIFKFDGKIKDKSMPTPRSWAFCSKLIAGRNDYEKVETLVNCSVGEFVAGEFIAFLKLTEKINAEDILKNPEKIKEIKEIDLKYSLLSSLSEYYQKHKNEDTLKKVTNVVKELEVEFGVLLLRMVKAIDEKFLLEKVKTIKPLQDYMIKTRQLVV